MTHHLTDERLTEVLGGEAPTTAERAHLEACLGCRRELTALGELIATGRDDLGATTPDWRAQRARVLAAIAEGAGQPRRVAAGPWRRWRTALVSAAAVAVTAAGLVALRPPSPERGDLPVADILAESDALLAEDDIPGFGALEPSLDELTSLVERIEKDTDTGAS